MSELTLNSKVKRHNLILKLSKNCNFDDYKKSILKYHDNIAGFCVDNALFEDESSKDFLDLIFEKKCFVYLSKTSDDGSDYILVYDRNESIRDYYAVTKRFLTDDEEAIDSEKFYEFLDQVVGSNLKGIACSCQELFYIISDVKYAHLKVLVSYNKSQLENNDDLAKDSIFENNMIVLKIDKT